MKATDLKAFLFTLLLLGAVPAGAQEAPPVAAEDTAANPLSTLNEQVKEVLAKAAVPFSEDQERAIALMMEERRRASEELFGSLMDFRSGPTQGQEEDRLRSAKEGFRVPGAVADTVSVELSMLSAFFRA